MPNLKHTCPECIRNFTFPSEKQGRTVKCPACGKPIVLPGSIVEKPLEDSQPTANAEATTSSDTVFVTTCDLKRDYEVLGPVYFQVSNRGLFSNKLQQLKRHYQAELANGPSPEQFGFGNLVDSLFTANVGQTDFEVAFYISIIEIRRIATSIGADAVVGFRQDTDLDTNGFQYFYMQCYGTAVRFTAD